MQRPERERKEPTEFNVIVKAKDLVKHTFTITNSTERYPKKYRFTLVNRIQDKAVDIYECVLEANELDLMKRKLKKLAALHAAGRIDAKTVEQSYQSWRGHAEKGNSYHLIRRTDHYYNSLMKSKEAAQCQKH